MSDHWPRRELKPPKTWPIEWVHPEGHPPPLDCAEPGDCYLDSEGKRRYLTNDLRWELVPDSPEGWV